MTAIELVDVTVEVGTATGSRLLLDRIDLCLDESRIAVIGANGSGKSTLLRLLNGLVAPSSGTVTVHGMDTVWQGRMVRQQVGFVFTDPLAQLVMSTPIEDIELSLRSRYRNRREREAAALALLEERGLAHLARQSIYDLSGGERQLVALTSVLAVQPQIIVADEPTTLLDLRHRRRLAEVFDALEHQLIVSTHDLNLAMEFDRILVVDQGRIFFDGDPAEGVSRYQELMQ